MSSNFNPNTIEKLANLSDEQIADILDTKYTAADIAKQQKALEQLKEQLCNPKQITIKGWVLQDDNKKYAYIAISLLVTRRAIGI